MKEYACYVMALTVLLQAQLVAARPRVLANERVRVTISETGALTSVENLQEMNV